jgi:DNA-binding beta-propeller fold protein YncE
MQLDPIANEMFVADGYGNRRVVVFDAASRRLQAPLGRLRGRAERREAAELRPGEAAVEAVRQSRCIAYGCRTTARSTSAIGSTTGIQVFDRAGKFLHEFRVEVQTLAQGAVGTWCSRTIPTQHFMYVADGANGRIYVLRRTDGVQIGSFGRTGRMAGEFKWIHNLAIDESGNLYTASRIRTPRAEVRRSD